LDLQGTYRTRHLEIIKNIEEFLAKSDSSGLYTTIINKCKAIKNSENGFWLYFYEINDQSFDDYEEFNYYHLKIKRAEKLVDEIIELDIENKLKKGIKQLSKHTSEFINKSNKKRIDINIYREFVNKIIKEMIPNDLHIFNKLELNTSDLNRNLPTLSNPIITKKYFVNKDGKTPSSDYYPSPPFEMTRSIMGNNFIFPTEIHERGVEIWYGIKPGPKIGGGYKEIWSKSNDKWECQSWKPTWRS